MWFILCTKNFICVFTSKIRSFLASWRKKNKQKRSDLRAGYSIQLLLERVNKFEIVSWNFCIVIQDVFIYFFKKRTEFFIPEWVLHELSIEAFGGINYIYIFTYIRIQWNKYSNTIILVRSERIKESQYAAKSISNKLMELEAFFPYVTNSKKQTTVHNFFVYIYTTFSLRFK